MRSFAKFVLFAAVLTVFQLSLIEPACGAKDAKGLYGTWCSQCHGPEGKGDGINSTPDMAINPRDHTDSGFMITRSDVQFEQIISHGGTAHAKSPLMPMWYKTLTPEEIKALVRYLRELCGCG